MNTFVLFHYPDCLEDSYDASITFFQNGWYPWLTNLEGVYNIFSGNICSCDFIIILFHYYVHSGYIVHILIVQELGMVCKMIVLCVMLLRLR
jgi:hypothetical protein